MAQSLLSKHCHRASELLSTREAAPAVRHPQTHDCVGVFLTTAPLTAQRPDSSADGVSRGSRLPRRSAPGTALAPTSPSGRSYTRVRAQGTQTEVTGSTSHRRTVTYRRSEVAHGLQLRNGLPTAPWRRRELDFRAPCPCPTRWGPGAGRQGVGGPAEQPGPPEAAARHVQQTHSRRGVRPALGARRPYLGVTSGREMGPSKGRAGWKVLVKRPLRALLHPVRWRARRVVPPRLTLWPCPVHRGQRGPGSSDTACHHAARTWHSARHSPLPGRPSAPCWEHRMARWDTDVWRQTDATPTSLLPFALAAPTCDVPTVLPAGTARKARGPRARAQPLLAPGPCPRTHTDDQGHAGRAPSPRAGRPQPGAGDSGMVLQSHLRPWPPGVHRAGGGGTEDLFSTPGRTHRPGDPGVTGCKEWRGHTGASCQRPRPPSVAHPPLKRTLPLRVTRQPGDREEASAGRHEHPSATAAVALRAQREPRWGCEGPGHGCPLGGDRPADGPPLGEEALEQQHLADADHKQGDGLAHGPVRDPAIQVLGPGPVLGLPQPVVRL